MEEKLTDKRTTATTTKKVTKKEEAAQLCDGKQKRKKQQKHRQFNRCLLLSGTVFYYGKIQTVAVIILLLLVLYINKKTDNFPEIVRKKDQTTRLENTLSIMKTTTFPTDVQQHSRQTGKLSTLCIKHAHHRNMKTKTFDNFYPLKSTHSIRSSLMNDDSCDDDDECQTMANVVFRCYSSNTNTHTHTSLRAKHTREKNSVR